MASLGLCWREAREAQAQTRSREPKRFLKNESADEKPAPGGGWGFRRPNPRRRLAYEARFN